MTTRIKRTTALAAVAVLAIMVATALIAPVIVDAHKARQEAARVAREEAAKEAAAEAARVAREEAAAEAARVAREEAAAEAARRIAEGEVWIGMTADQAVESLGLPTKAVVYKDRLFRSWLYHPDLPEDKEILAGFHFDGSSQWILEKIYELEGVWIQNKGPLKIGMTDSEVFGSWGPPSDKNKTTTAHGVSEQWIYRTGYSDKVYLYFDDAILTSWQE